MTHPNQSFIDGFFRNNKPQGNNSYYYSKEFIEEQRKKKFNEFLKESISPNKKQTSKYMDDVLNLFGYNTLSNNKNKQEYITEARLTAKELPQQFVYNGLLYSFNKELGVFINQHGHSISIEQATAFMQMILLEEVEVSEMDSSIDGSRQESQIFFEDQTLLVFTNGNPTFPPLASTSPIIGKAYYPYGRISANPSKDEAMPSAAEVQAFFASNPGPMGKKAIFPHPIQSAWNDSLWLSIAGNSVQDCVNINDSCRDPNNTSIFIEAGITNRPAEQSGSQWAGIQKFASPWLDNATNRTKPLWYTWLNDVKNSGITFDIVMGNVDDSTFYSPAVLWSQITRKNTDNGGDGLLTHYGHIINDTRIFSATAGNAIVYGSLYDQLKINNGYTLSDFNVRDFSTGVSAGYVWWNYVMSRLGASYVEDGFYNPFEQLMPNAQVSNYGNFIVSSSDNLSDSNGHKQYYDNKIGNAVGAICYGEMGGVAVNSKIDPSDPTSLVIDFGVTGPDRFGYDRDGNKSGWRCFQLDQQWLKSLYRNKGPYDYIHVWIKSRKDIYNDAFGGASTMKRNEYWKENLYHISALNPDAILYFNQYGGIGYEGPILVNYDELVTDVFEEVNTLKNNKKSIPVLQTYQKLNYSDYYLASGCRIWNNTNLWRISVNYDFVTNLIVNGTSFDVSTTPGIWYTTPPNISQFTVSSYNSITKTLNLLT